MTTITKASKRTGPALERVRAAISSAESRLAELETKASEAAANVPRSAAASVLSGSESRFRTATEAHQAATLARDEARAVLTGLQDEARGLLARAEAADVAERDKEARRLLTEDVTGGMRKIQTGLDLVIAGYRQVRASAHASRMAFPVQPPWWPDLWGNQLEGQMRRYLAPRGGPFGGNIYSSQFDELLAGLDLVDQHLKAVREVLESMATDKEKAA